jgi:hypothetical protein
MTPKQFFKASYLFDNFYPEDLANSFNYEEIEQIPNTEIYQLGVFTLSQILNGLSEEPIETLKQMSEIDRKKVLWSWTNVLEDIEYMRRVTSVIVDLT